MIVTLSNRLFRFFRLRPWLIVVLSLFLAHLADFWPFYFQKLLPFPGDMLVTFYFPWSGGGFAGFDPWTTHKALNTVDVIKQFYPWKVFASNLIHHGIWPLWNPYSFSGMPFIANLQSGLFFPTNVIYLFLPVLVGWVSNILFQLLIFGVFFYLFLRSEKLSQAAAIFGAIVGMNLSYLTLWHWQLVITESALLLPLTLYFVNIYYQTRKTWSLLVIPLLLAASFLGGHAQTTIYVYLIFVIFALYRRIGIKNLIFVSVLPFFLAAIQLMPSAEAYLLSAREGAATKELFAPFVFQWKHVITVLAPDYFGHPSNQNFFGIDYRDMNAYFGVTGFVFAALSLVWFRVNKNVRFYLFLALAGLLLAARPLVFIFDIFNVPVLSSGVPARMIFVFQFAGAVLSAYGLDYWLKSRSRHESRNALFWVFLIGLSFVLLWAIAFLGIGVNGQVARNNLVLPTGFFLLTSFLIFLGLKFSGKIKYVLFGGLLILLFFQYSYFFNRYNSFSPPAFVFPAHPVITYLQQNAGIDRFYGTEQASINYNFSVYYRLFDFEGYDSMYPRRYGELVASYKTGTIPPVIPRSDAYIQGWSNDKTGRLLDILGVKYLLDKNDLSPLSWNPEPAKFPPDRYRLLWQESKWKIYERRNVLPRISLFGQYIIETDKEKIIEKLYDPNFAYQNELVLEEKPAILPVATANKNINLVSYTANRVELTTQADKPQLLFLSDNYYPGWEALVDGKNVPILRADYTFRAVALDSGQHQVIFNYNPISFKVGAGITVAALIILLTLLIKSVRHSDA